jgi:uncharacterized RDD family membrane protein YckC
MESAIAPEVCGSCGSRVLPDGKFCLFCGDVLTESGRLLRVASPHGLGFQTSRGSIPFIVPTVDSMEYAGFWRRVWAGLIDVSLEIVVALLISVVIDMAFSLVGRAFGIEHESAAYVTGFTFIILLAVGGWLYAALSESSRYRATLGKRIMRLQVVNAAGNKLTFNQASARHVMKFLSLFSLGFGFLMAGWTKRRQALHDLPTDCRVIRVPEESFSLFGKHL